MKIQYKTTRKNKYCHDINANEIIYLYKNYLQITISSYMINIIAFIHRKKEQINNSIQIIYTNNNSQLLINEVIKENKKLEIIQNLRNGLL